MTGRLIDPRIKLRHITCFLEIARLRSVNNAAQALNISQPAASRTVQELEQFLGNSLFDRSRRRLSLTPFGDVFFRYASTALVALRQGVDAASGSTSATTVTVGALPTVSARMLPAAVSAHTASHPGIRIRVVTGPNNYLLSLLRTADVDFVIGRMAEPDIMTGLSFEHLYPERVVLVVRPGHPLLGVADFQLGMVEPYQVLMPTPDSIIRRPVDRLFLAHGFTRIRDEIETVSNAFGRSYVQQTDAVWAISEGVVALDVEAGLLALLPLDTSQTMGPVGFTCRTDNPASPDTLALMRTVRDVAATIN